jgi:hypothetical protein
MEHPPLTGLDIKLFSIKYLQVSTIVCTGGRSEIPIALALAHRIRGLRLRFSKQNSERPEPDISQLSLTFVHTNLESDKHTFCHAIHANHGISELSGGHVQIREILVNNL